MKILQVTFGFPPFQKRGGTYHLAHLLSVGLAGKKDVEIYVFSAGLPDEIRKEFVDENRSGMKIRRIHSSSDEYLDRRIPDVRIISYKNLHIEELFEDFIKNVKPDIVHFQHTIRLSSSLIYIARRYAEKVVLSLQDFWHLCPRVHLLKPNGEVCRGPEFGLSCFYCRAGKESRQSRKDWRRSAFRQIAPIFPSTMRNFAKDKLIKIRDRESKREYEKALPFITRNKLVLNALQRCDYILSPSEYLTRSYEQIGDIAQSKMVTISLGIEPFEIGERKFNENRVVFGFAGSPTRHKGSQMLLRAYSRIPKGKSRLVIWGENWEGEKEGLGLSNDISLRGAFSQEDKGKVFSSFDILVIPSIWGETFSFIAHEAFHARVPVIGPDIGVFPDIIQDQKNGLIFKTGNENSLFQCLMKIVSTPELVVKYAKNIKRPKIDVEYISEIFEFYKKILKS